MRIAMLLLLGTALLLGACHMRRKIDPGFGTAMKARKEGPIETHPWPDYVTGEERAKIEAAINTIFEVGGIDARDAEAYLVNLDVGAAATSLRSSGRLVSEMKHVIDRHKIEEYEGKSRIMVLDRMLRKVDGVQERLFGEEYGLDIDDSAARALRLVRGWNWWYRTGRFLERYEPWDPRVDMVDNNEMDDLELDD